MPRSPRITPAGYVYHVLNRGVERRTLFSQDADYEAFREILAEGVARFLVRLITYVVMPNHWHLVLWPKINDELSAFMHWVTGVHSVNVRLRTRTKGVGHVYQDRYKSFPVQEPRHYWKLLHYVDANPIRAGLVPAAEEWRWSRLGDLGHVDDPICADGPWPAPANWIDIVNQPIPKEELDALRVCARRGRPYGSREWVIETAQQLRLERSIRKAGGRRVFETAISKESFK